jgi:hypothetical protein
MTLAKKRKGDSSEEQVRRVRRICAAMPGTTERLSHGEPTFFVHKKVFAMFANNHHNDGHIAVWIPLAPGLQPVLIGSAPEKFYRPPYVGVRGWVGVELEQVGDEELAYLVRQAWQMTAPKNLRSAAQDQHSRTS